MTQLTEDDFKWKETKKYARIYYQLTKIFEDIESKKDNDGFNIEQHKPTEKALEKMIKVLQSEGIYDKKEILGFIMQSCKGQSNPQLVSKMLDKIGEKNE